MMRGHSPSTREQLLRVAARQFAAKGFEGASMRAIAAEVGIQAASIFHHFPDGKAQLYDEIVQGVIHAITEQLADWENRAADPIGAIIDICLLFWDYFDDNEAAASVLLRDAFDPDSERGRAIRRQSENILRIATHFIRNGQKAGQLRSFEPSAFIFWACVYVLNFHGSVGIREAIWSDVPRRERKRKGRAEFVRDVEHYLRP